jgi:hypothetical protein
VAARTPCRSSAQAKIRCQQQQQQQLSQLRLVLRLSTTFCRLLMALREHGSAYTLQVHYTERIPLSAAAAAAAALAAEAWTAAVRLSTTFCRVLMALRNRGSACTPCRYNTQSKIRCQQQQLSQLGLRVQCSTTFCRLLMALWDRGSAYTLQAHHTEHDQFVSSSSSHS